MTPDSQSSKSALLVLRKLAGLTTLLTIYALTGDDLRVLLTERSWQNVQGFGVPTQSCQHLPVALMQGEACRHLFQWYGRKLGDCSSFLLSKSTSSQIVTNVLFG